MTLTLYFRSTTKEFYSYNVFVSGFLINGQESFIACTGSKKTVLRLNEKRGKTGTQSTYMHITK